MTWDTWLTIFMEALLKRFNGILLPSGFGKATSILSLSLSLACEGVEVKLNFCGGGMGSSCLGFKSSDALRFYETAETGTLRAAGECVM